MEIQVVQDTLTAVQDSLQKTAEISAGFSNIWQVDCNGNGNSIALTIIGMGIVFLSLVLMYLIVQNLGNFLHWRNMLRRKKESGNQSINGSERISGDVNAAIAMALYLYSQEIHDFENTVLTIKKVSKTYSPWSSKIYSLRNNPRIPWQ